MSKVVVIGAGAAGVVAALRAVRRHEVVLVDGNDKCGKKILLTGNGRCNYWNRELCADMYEADDMEALARIINEYNANSVLCCLEQLGIYPKIKNGYYYPYSNQASSVRELFERKISDSKIEFKRGFKAVNITKNDSGFTVSSDKGEKITCERLIIATGSKAAPKTGSDGSGYELAKSLGHSINPVAPALTPLISKGNFLKEWEKIRCDARVSLYVDGKLIKEDEGEIQLTATGISGICTFNISGVASRSLEQGKSVKVKINFMPCLETDFYTWFSSRCAVMGNVSIEQTLESIFNYKLMFVLLKSAGVSKDELWFKLNENKKRALCSAVESFSLDITGAASFDKAQVCTGGVPLSEINPKTMESKIAENTYFAGEILDADGRCGGYNLAFAFISGYIAGESV